jgi:hypothetical protein
MASNSTNGSSSVGGSPGGKGNVSYSGQTGQPQMGQPPQQSQQPPQQAQNNNVPNQYQNTIQPWNVSGMTGQQGSGKGKGH